LLVGHPYAKVMESMREVPLLDYADLSPSDRDEIARVITSQRTLGDVLAWGRTHTPPRIPREIVTQDEYTHDVVVHWGGHLFLAYDTT
jgi:hypothetical protein